MWRQDKNKERAGSLALEDAAALASATATATAADSRPDGTMFSHPGAFGAAMLPPKAVKAGFFARRQRKASGNTHTDDPNESLAEIQQQQQQPLCSGDPARVDELVLQAKQAKDAERALRQEAATLQTRKARLEREVLKLQRDKEDMTAAHRDQLEWLRRELEADARDGARRLESELERGHAKSMDDLRLTLRSETERLAGETERLCDDLERAKLAQSTAGNKKKTGGGGRGSGRSHSSGTSLNGVGGLFGDDAAGGVAAPVPESPGFWRSLTKTFSPRDFDGLTGAAGGGQWEGGGVPPPVLLVLAAVPLFCFYRRWQDRR